MLELESLKAAAIVNKDLEKIGYKIEFGEFSPIAAIISYVDRPTDDEIENMTPEQAFESVIRYTSDSYLDDNNTCGYDRIMDKMTNTLSPMLRRFFQVMRENVNPFIKDLVEKINEDLLVVTNPVEHGGYEVSEAYLPDIIKNGSFLNEVRKWKAGVSLDQPLPKRPELPEITIEEVREIITNSFGGEFTNDISNWLENRDIDFEIYNTIYNKATRSNLNMGELFIHKSNGLDLSIGAFLLGLGLLYNKTPNGSVSTEAEYEDGIKIIIGQAAFGICYYLDKIERNAKLGIMVFNNANNKITVNPLLYKDWIKDGGDVETLYGLSLYNRPYQTIDEINTNKEALRKRWDDFKTKYSSEESVRYLEKAKEAIIRNYVKIIKDKYQGEDSTLGIDNNKAIEMMEHMVGYVKLDDLKNMYVLCRKIVCRSKFSNMEADKFLEDISNHMVENSKITVNEAATFATISFLSRNIWMFNGKY